VLIRQNNPTAEAFSVVLTLMIQNSPGGMAC
jgi:hypothetical protein